MDEEETVNRLREAAATRRRTEADATTAFEAVIVAALRDGVRPKVIAEATDYSYETIRRIARANDVERLREPTVTSRKKAS